MSVEALTQLPCSIFGPVFQPRRAGDPMPFLASCSCGAHIRSERHGVVASWVTAHEKGDQ